MYVVPDYNRYLDQEGDHSGEPYAQRDSYGGNVNGAVVNEYNDYNGVEYTGKLPAYAVVVGYRTGDTFGYDYRATVLDVFEDEETAERLARMVESHTEGYSFDFEGKNYHADWIGYFESLSSVGVHTVSKPQYRYRRR